MYPERVNISCLQMTDGPTFGGNEPPKVGGPSLVQPGCFLSRMCRLKRLNRCFFTCSPHAGLLHRSESVTSPLRAQQPGSAQPHKAILSLWRYQHVFNEKQCLGRLETRMTSDSKTSYKAFGLVLGVQAGSSHTTMNLSDLETAYSMWSPKEDGFDGSTVR